MTRQELRTELDDIKARLKLLEKKKAQPVGGDPEYFDQPGQLSKLALQVEALIAALKEQFPDVHREYVRRYT